MGNTEETGKNVEKKKDSLHKQDSKLEKAESRLHNMEKLLVESEDKYKALIEKSVHGILVIQGLIIKYANKAMLDTFGCRDEGEIVGHDFMEFVSSKHRKPVLKEIRFREKSKEPLLQYEYIALRGDGSEFEAELSLHAITYQGTAALQGIVRDITDEKRMRDEAEESKKMFNELELRAQLLDSATDSIFLHDIDGTIYYANEAAYSSRGYTKEELLGMNFRRLVVPEYSKFIKSTLRDLLKKGEIVFESAQYRKGGSILPVEVYARVIEANGKKLILRVDRDIGTRRKIENDLKLKAQLLDQANDEVIVRDIDGIVIYANEAACRSHGYRKEEIIGMNIRQLVPSEASGSVGERTKEILEQGHKLYEAVRMRQNGSVMPIELNATAFEVGNRKYIISISHDTTERKRMEEELKLRAQVLDQALDAIIVRDLEGNIVYANEVAAHKYGYNSQEIIGKNITQFMLPEQLERIKQRTKVIIKKGYDRYEAAWTADDGSSTPVEVNARLFECDGKRLIISVCRDIEERKRMDDELKLRAQLLDNAYDFIFARGQGNNLIYANELACRTLGYSREEMMKLNIADILAHYDPDEMERKTSELYRDGEREMEVVLVGKDGTRIPVEARSRVVELNNQKYVISVSRDISQRKKAEEELKLRAYLLDNAKDSIFVYDQEGNLLYVNKEAYESRGYTREELMSMNIRQLTHQRNVVRVEKRLKEWFKQGYSCFEAVHVRKDGSELPVEIYVRHLEIGDKKLFVSVSRDVSERKKIEKERYNLARKAQFSSHLASIGELAAGVAHEINNPLTAVVGYSQLLMQKDLPEDIIKDLNNIREGAKRVADIVSRLLTFAQHRRLERAYANINEVIETTLSLRDYELKTNNIEVVTDYDPDLRWTIVDVGQLQQVFLNLIINAETEMKLKHDGGKLLISTRQENGIIRISFKDNGPGITKENINKIFDPFFTTREVGQGTGLGLSMCHGIIKEHNGNIFVKSSPGKGATFIIELPVVTEPKQLELEESESQVVDVTKKAMVLVIDDEPMVGELLTEWLTSLGHVVEVADNAKNAIAMVKDKMYSMILLDIKMPGMSGIELYDYFRKEIPSLIEKIVFITGDIIGYDTLKFLSMTRAHYVTKPFDYEYFKQEINKVIARS